MHIIDVKFVKWEKETGTVLVELTGHCAHCPMAGMTLKHGIEAEIIKAIPEVKSVEAI
jgi:Fe-S cluster biogenesis protein NfuA